MTTNRTLVFDASPLNHFARANELDTLQVLTTDFRCVTTRAVQDELTLGVGQHSALQEALALPWIDIVPCDNLKELLLFGDYLFKLGNLKRNAGEATMLAWAEAHDGIAYVDDRAAWKAGRAAGLRVHRTLQLIIAGTA